VLREFIPFEAIVHSIAELTVPILVLLISPLWAVYGYRQTLSSMQARGLVLVTTTAAIVGIYKMGLVGSGYQYAQLGWANVTERMNIK